MWKMIPIAIALMVWVYPMYLLSRIIPRDERDR